MATFEISCSAKIAKMDEEIQIRSVLSQFSNLIYGDGSDSKGKSVSTGVNGILGKSQSIKVRKNNLEESTIILHFPVALKSKIEIANGKNQRQIRQLGQMGDLSIYLKNMMNHASKNKI